MKLGRVKWFLDYRTISPTKVIYVIRYSSEARCKLLERVENNYSEILHSFSCGTNLEEAVQYARNIVEIGNKQLYIEQFLLNCEGGELKFIDEED